MYSRVKCLRGGGINGHTFIEIDDRESNLDLALYRFANSFNLYRDYRHGPICLLQVYVMIK